MSIVNILTKLFPFLPLFLLFGCPNYDQLLDNEDYSAKVEKSVTADVRDSARALTEEEVERERLSHLDTNSEEVIEVAVENYTSTQRENKIKNVIARLDSLNTSLNWKLIKDNLYLNNKGEVGFQFDYVTEVGTTKNYITRFCERDSSLNQVIDIKSFKHLGSTFYKDKKNIYHYYDMAYGGRFSIYTPKDYATFQVVGDHYAKDKYHIYGERAGILKNVDYASFVSEIGAGPYAKDKYGYYFWNELTLTHTEFYKKYKRKSVSVLEYSQLITKR